MKSSSILCITPVSHVPASFSRILQILPPPFDIYDEGWLFPRLQLVYDFLPHTRSLSNPGVVHKSSTNQFSFLYNPSNPHCRRCLSNHSREHFLVFVSGCPVFSRSHFRHSIRFLLSSDWFVFQQLSVSNLFRSSPLVSFEISHDPSISSTLIVIPSYALHSSTSDDTICPALCSCSSLSGSSVSSWFQIVSNWTFLLHLHSNHGCQSLLFYQQN